MRLAKPLPNAFLLACIDSDTIPRMEKQIMRKPTEKSGPDCNSAVPSWSIDRRRFLQSAACTAAGVLAPRAVHASPVFAALPATNPAKFRTGQCIASTPTFRYRPYRSKSSPTADTTSWVQIDLGREQPIESVFLYPANQRMVPGKDQYYAGEAFPVRFKIEASSHADFSQPKLIVDLSNTDFDNPGDNILGFPAKHSVARYVRLTVSKLAKPDCMPKEQSDAPEGMAFCDADGPYRFALSRIGVISEGGDISISRQVTADPNYGNASDLSQLTRPERIEGEYIHRDRPQYVTDAATWKRVTCAAEVPRTGVTLHGGLFETAMRNNIRYLMNSYTLDDLLIQFRERAGKPLPPSSRKPDQFWETDLAGSNAGRFLMGAGNTLRWIDDPELRTRFNALVDGIAECRQSDGYVMAYPQDSIFYSERGAYTRAWLTHGLIEAGYAGRADAFQLLRGNYDWFDRQSGVLPDLLRGAVQGGQGMIANTRVYFTPAGKPEDMQVIQRYYLEDKWLESLARGEKEAIWQYPYDRPHCYLLTNLEAYLDLYLATGDRRIHDGVKAAWEMYKAHWQQPGGSFSIIEYNYDPPDSNSLSQKLGELCGNSFWTFLSQRFQLMNPGDERYATEIDKSIYNVAIANQEGSQGLRYHAILVGQKEKGTRLNTCCEGQGTRLLGSLPEHIYSIAPDGLYVNLFEPSTIRWQHRGAPMQLAMKTNFPAGLQVECAVSTPKTTQAVVRIRVPSWATSEMTVSVDGEHAGSGKPGSYIVLDRHWSDGDRIGFRLPAAVRARRYTGADQIAGKARYSFEYGPILLAAVGSSKAEFAKPIGAEHIAAYLEPIEGEPLHFTVHDNPGMKFVPYFEIAQEEFTCFPAVPERA
jgi:DUF1680 family protein